MFGVIVQKILGLDIGANAVKAVLVEANFRNHEVRAFRRELLGPSFVEGAEEQPTLADRLRPALEALAVDDFLTADVIVCSLPGAPVATHMVTLPFNDPRRVEQTLPFEVEGLIPFELEDVVFDHHVVSRSPGKTELLVAVARKDDVREAIEALAACGVDPQVVTFSAIELAQLQAEGYVEKATTEPTDETGTTGPALEAFVDIGAGRTDVVLIEGGLVQFARTFASGGEDVTRAISRATTLPSDAAALVKHALQPDDSADPTVRMAAERAMAALFREVRATFAAHANHTRRKVSRVHLSGGGARLAGLSEYLSEALGIPVQPLQLASGRSFPDTDALLPGTLALSLALRGLGNRNAPRMTFRKGEFASTRSSGGLQGRLGALAAMAAALLVLFGFSSWAKLSALEQQEVALDDQLCATTQKILGKCETDYKVALGKLKGRGSPAANVPQVGASDVLLAVTRAFPAGDAAVLAELDVVEEVLRMRGDAKSYEAVDTLVEKLQEDECFGEVKKGRLVKGKDNRIDFDLDASYVCGHGARKAGS